MSEYIGTVGSKIKMEVTYKKRFQYSTHFTYYGENHNVFCFEDEVGNRIVWDTTSWLEDKKLTDERGMCKPIWEGSKLLVTATVKEHKEYKGTKQTTLSRPRFTVIEMAKSPEEIQEEKLAKEKQKKEEQLASIAADDLVWEMPYRQYKEHYADCETIIDSYDAHDGRIPATIKVIIRKGRLKKSGVRGENFFRFVFKLENGCDVCYKATCIENAEKRIKKEYPNMKFESKKIYR